MHYPIAYENTWADPDTARDIFLNYTRYWDYHRQKFDKLPVLEGGFLYAFVTLCIAIWFAYRNKTQNIPRGELLFYAMVIASTLLSWPLVFIPSWFDPAMFPDFLVILMPGRFINISILLCTPLLVAILCRHKSWFTPVRYVVAMLIFYMVTITRYGNGYAALFQFFIDIELLVICTAGIIGAGQYIQRRPIPLPPNISLQIKAWASVGVILLLYLSPVFLAYELSTVRKRNFAQVKVPPNIEGSILTTMEHYLVQAETRVSSITPHIDGYSYIGNPAILLALDRFTSDLYGISLAVPPAPHLSLHYSVIGTNDYQKLWQSRTCEEWEKLASKYHFGLILVAPYMPLRLPRVDADPKWNKYRPTCAG
ncbi:MAG: hypothetical protein Q7S51_01515 [Gallionellaceae bacterium]|nr:hypothetical protein [Gallionellaceae bacterium]